jgi:hypothetical protein
VVAVPDISPDELFRVKPVGSVPDETDQVTVPAMPVSLKVWLYGAPTAVFGKLAGVINASA